MLTRIESSNVTFGYRHRLKDLYKKGLLPLKYGFYGGRLTKDNVSLEHIRPYSQGGKTELDNLVLATKENNQARGNKNIIPFLDEQNLIRYLTPFKNLILPDFDGNKYIKQILSTLQKIIGENQNG